MSTVVDEAEAAETPAPARPHRTLRRRFDNATLRWQARLDSEWSDRVLPWLVTGALFVVLLTLSLARARSLDGGVDLGRYTQAAWLVGQGDEPVTTVKDSTNLLSQQAAFAFYPIAWLTLLALLAGLPAILIVWTYRDPRELVVALGLTSLTSVAYGAFLMWAFIG